MLAAAYWQNKICLVATFCQSEAAWNMWAVERVKYQYDQRLYIIKLDWVLDLQVMVDSQVIETKNGQRKM